MSRPTVDSTLAVVDAVGMCRNKNRSRASPRAGEITITATMNAAHCGQFWYWFSRS